MQKLLAYRQKYKIRNLVLVFKEGVLAHCHGVFMFWSDRDP